MLRRILLAGCALPLLLSACASNPTALVIPRENNQFETIGMGKTRVIALGHAMQSATAACKNGSRPIVVNDQSQYRGVVNEQTGRIVDQVGGIIGAITGNSTPSISRDDDYEVTVRFYCQR